ncbi:hypothetical protein BFZC1_15525 [Lysinibacillus fusiformis ZC1]|nr:hypothetical protein BFZC1_15525 [Lysinibacillus fusiformis ZC1]
MCYYESGSSNEVTLVFSCPGQKEMKLKRPAAGTTGTNLDIVLKYLNNYKGIEWNRENITITNSWPNIEYIKFTGRSEATKHEITHSDNLERLYDDIKDTTKYIICFGENANYAVNQINQNLLASIISARHLSSRNLNANIKEDINGNKIIKSTTDIEKEKNTKARLEVVAKEIKEAIEDLE